MVKENLKAVNLLIDRVLEENEIISPPVDVVQICKNYNLGIFESDLGSSNLVSGFLDPQERRIYLNQNDSVERKNFTIAHELGHWLMHRDLVISEPDKYAIMYRMPLGKNQKDPYEVEANFFAANLLVPTQFLNKFYKSKNYDLASLSVIFGVSTEVISYRIKNQYE